MLKNDTFLHICAFYVISKYFLITFRIGCPAVLYRRLVSKSMESMACVINGEKADFLWYEDTPNLKIKSLFSS